MRKLVSPMGVFGFICAPILPALLAMNYWLLARSLAAVVGLPADPIATVELGFFKQDVTAYDLLALLICTMQALVSGVWVGVRLYAKEYSNAVGCIALPALSIFLVFEVSANTFRSWLNDGSWVSAAQSGAVALAIAFGEVLAGFLVIDMGVVPLVMTFGKAFLELSSDICDLMWKLIALIPAMRVPKMGIGGAVRGVLTDLDAIIWEPLVRRLRGSPAVAGAALALLLLLALAIVAVPGVAAGAVVKAPAPGMPILLGVFVDDSKSVAPGDAGLYPELFARFILAHVRSGDEMFVGRISEDPWNMAAYMAFDSARQRAQVQAAFTAVSSIPTGQAVYTDIGRGLSFYLKSAVDLENATGRRYRKVFVTFTDGDPTGPQTVQAVGNFDITITIYFIGVRNSNERALRKLAGRFRIDQRNVHVVPRGGWEAWVAPFGLQFGRMANSELVGSILRKR